MKPPFLIEARPDLGRLAVCLNKEFSLFGLAQPQVKPMTPFPIGDYTVGGVDCRGFLEEWWPQMLGVIAETHAAIDERKPAGCLLWNTVLPRHAAIALTCRARGVPVFEVCHWGISTLLIGHFENASLADFLFCTEEHARFMSTQPKWGGKLVVGGRPQYDGWRPKRDRRDVRRKLGIPVDELYVLKTSTWTHTYTDWSHEHWKAAHDAAIVQAFRIIQKAIPIHILWSTRGQDPKPVAEKIQQLGLQNVHLTADEGIKDLVEASDLVVCQKSGAAVDALVAGRPSITVDFHPQNDDFLWKGRGLYSARTFDRVVDLMEKILAKPGWRGRALREGEKNLKYFGMIPGSSGAVAARIKKECDAWQTRDSAGSGEKPASGGESGTPSETGQPNSSTGTGSRSPKSGRCRKRKRSSAASAGS